VSIVVYYFHLSALQRLHLNHIDGVIVSRSRLDQFLFVSFL